MDSYLQQYGVSDERRNKVLRAIILSLVGVSIVAVVAYLLLADYSEEKRAKQFIGEINAGKYKEAYVDWGCTNQHPCPNYDYNRFLEDWGPQKKFSAPWKVVSTDSCKLFVTVNVRAGGSELESLSVQRSDNSLGFAPSPECQERKWRWSQFFKQYFGKSEPPPKPGHG